jgi:hypothetical protein
MSEVIAGQERPDVADPVVVSDPATNPYIAAAMLEAAELQALAERYGDDGPPLTPSELRIVAMTSAEALEEAAVFAEALPNVGGELSDVAELRDTNHYIFAQQRVREAAEKVVRRVDQAIDRKKLRGVRIARGLYRIARVYAKSTSNDTAMAHIERMQRTLRISVRRRKAAVPATPPVKEVKA